MSLWKPFLKEDRHSANLSILIAPCSYWQVVGPILPSETWQNGTTCPPAVPVCGCKSSELFPSPQQRISAFHGFFLLCAQTPSSPSNGVDIFVVLFYFLLMLFQRISSPPPSHLSQCAGRSLLSRTGVTCLRKSLSCQNSFIPSYKHLKAMPWMDSKSLPPTSVCSPSAMYPLLHSLALHPAH